MTCIDKGEVFGSLDDKENYILDIKNEWGCPVHDVVNEALGRGANDQMVVFHTHVNYSISEIKIIIHLMKAVVDGYFVLGEKDGFDMSPFDASLNNAAENYGAISSSACYDSTIMTPRKVE